MKDYPQKKLADAYKEDGIINYRHIIMCPGHLVEKWKTELQREIPYAKPVIIENFQQLVWLRGEGRERSNGKEFYIFSKEFLKFSYQRMPTPNRINTKYVEVFRCSDCGTLLMKKGKECPACKKTNIAIKKTMYKRRGLICPGCNRLLFSEDFVFEESTFWEPERGKPMQWTDMTHETQSNQRCIYCGEQLWMPFVKNISNIWPFESRKPSWIRQTFWANKAKKGKVTKWVFRGCEKEAALLFGVPVNSIDRDGGCRKYSPALFIKKYLKGFFDIFILDEAHKAKGGSTAQANAFHCLSIASCHTFCLTGTLAGGVATDLFYLLFRLEPSRMKAHGYNWGSVMKFAEDYGCIEKTFEPVIDQRRNQFSRGRQVGQPRVRPGISPRLFMDFLLDRAVFLDIPDMSANMPPLYERIVLCKPENKMEQDMIRSYQRILQVLKDYERYQHVNLSSMRNQFAMSYLDKPYGVSAIIDPKTGDEIIEPEDYGILTAEEGLLSKEKSFWRL